MDGFESLSGFAAFDAVAIKDLFRGCRLVIEIISACLATVSFSTFNRVVIKDLFRGWW